MAPLYCIDLTAAEQQRLLAIARRSIGTGPHDYDGGRQGAEAWTPALHPKRAVFVTLTQSARLRGCIGTIEPVAALATAVADSAHSAAYRDPRFPQMRVDELEKTAIEISVLTATEPLAAASRDALLAELRRRRVAVGGRAAPLNFFAQSLGAIARSPGISWSTAGQGRPSRRPLVTLPARAPLSGPDIWRCRLSRLNPPHGRSAGRQQTAGKCHRSAGATATQA